MNRQILFLLAAASLLPGCGSIAMYGGHHTVTTSSGGYGRAAPALLQADCPLRYDACRDSHNRVRDMAAPYPKRIVLTRDMLLRAPGHLRTGNWSCWYPGIENGRVTLDPVPVCYDRTERFSSRPPEAMECFLVVSGRNRTQGGGGLDIPGPMAYQCGQYVPRNTW